MHVIEYYVDLFLDLPNLTSDEAQDRFSVLLDKIMMLPTPVKPYAAEERQHVHLIMYGNNALTRNEHLENIWVKPNVIPETMVGVYIIADLLRNRDYLTKIQFNIIPQWQNYKDVYSDLIANSALASREQ